MLHYWIRKNRTFAFSTSDANLFLPADSRTIATLIKSSGTYTVVYGDGFKETFYANGRLKARIDRNANETTYFYSNGNGVGDLSRVTDNFGNVLSFRYNSNGYLDRICDGDDSNSNDPCTTGFVVANYGYYPTTNLLKEVSYRDGKMLQFDYDSQTTSFPLLATVRDSQNNILEAHQYDSQGRALTSEKQNGVEKYTFDYQHANDSIPFTIVSHWKNADDPAIVTTYNFDRSHGINLISKVVGSCSCGSASTSTEYEYDFDLNIKKVTDALSKETLMTWDSGGNMLTRKVLSGTTELRDETFTYNSFGQVRTYIDPEDGLWTYEYDSNGNLKSVKNPLNDLTSINYPSANNKGLPDSVVDGRGKRTDIQWHPTGLLKQIENADHKITSFTYDARGRVKTVTNALQQTTTYNYDDVNRKVETVFPDTHKITVEYDTRRLPLYFTDERGKVTTYTFDPQYRLTKITDPLGHTQEFGYDLMSNLSWVKDGLLNQTDYEYDDFNRLKKVIYPAAVAGATRLFETYEYDPVGRLKKFTDSANRITNLGYEDVLRLHTITNAENETTKIFYNKLGFTTEVIDAQLQTYKFTPDALGNVKKIERAGGSMTFDYDEVGNVKRRTDYFGRITRYKYDNLNRLQFVQYHEDGETGYQNDKEFVYDDLSRLHKAINETGTVTIDYDNRGRVQNVTDVFGHIVGYEYLRTNTEFETKLRLDGALQAIYKYDNAGRLDGIVNGSDNSLIDYGYDDANRLTSRVYPNSVSTVYGYDKMSRLTGITDSSASNGLFSRQYHYNNASQIDQITDGSATRIFGYDNVDRLTSVTGVPTAENYIYDDVGNRTSSHLSPTYGYEPFNRLTSTATASYRFDANGNMTSKSEGKNLWRFNWDMDNRLVTAATRKENVHYRYDALGRRVQRTQRFGKELTKFIYDGQDVLADDNNGVLTKYLNGAGVDNKLRVQTGNDVKYFLSDHLGSTNGLTDASGNLTASTSYDSFGNATNATFPSRYQFTGREYDNFTGLYYYRARFYDAKIGRFISEDPIGLNGGINQFGYVRGNPINATDPSGLVDQGWGADFADWADGKIDIAEEFYGGDPTVGFVHIPIYNDPFHFEPIKPFGMARGAGDMFRVGQGVGNALFCDNLDGWDRAIMGTQDLGRAAGLFAALGGAAARGLYGKAANPSYSGNQKPWRSGATPNSVYTHLDANGNAVQNAIYDSNGSVIGHVDFKNHGGGATSGHGHRFPVPGNPASGHGPGSLHIPYGQLPSNWRNLPSGVQPRVPIGQ